MRKIIIYLLIAVTFVTIIFCINAIKNTAYQQIAAMPTKQDGDESHAKTGYEFTTHLPLVVIETGGQQIKKDSLIWAEISIIDNVKGENRQGEAPDLSAPAVIKYRGSSSYYSFDKKQYRIEFREKYGEEKNADYEVMGMSAASDWVLNGPFLDRTLIRNHMVLAISRKLLSWAPDSCYCEIILDGEYLGVYVMIEPITKEKNGRLNLTNFGLVSGTTAYIVKRERSNTEENVIETYGSLNGLTSYELSISYPKARNLTKKQFEWIKNDISEFERVLYSERFDDPDLGYAAYIDVDNFIDYYIINELTLTTDAGYLSTYAYKDIGEKLKLTVWDFDNTFNNYVSVKSVDKFYVASSNWFSRLFEDRSFVDAVVIRYKELREGKLSQENLLGLVDENVAYLGNGIDRNFKIWGYTFFEKLLAHNEDGSHRDPKSYEEAIDQLKECIVARGKFLDENIEMLYQYCIN
ncbi:MAG: CotH kinase family protein [Christensenellales bacterium]|jgi:spore coat protein H